MIESWSYETFVPATDEDTVVRSTALAFGGAPDSVREWLRFAGHEHVRVLRRSDGAAAASLLALPMGQHFGGRSVPMEGVAAVAVPPESRGGGLGLALMREQVRSAAEAGVPLSCLYASTQALYRRVGYEQAGLLFRTHIPLRTIGVRDRSMPVRQLGETDDEAVRACYAIFARRFNGTLERGPYIWERVRRMRDETYSGLGVVAPEPPHTLEGYLFMAQRRKPETGRHDVAISDLAFTTARAGRRLLGLLSDLATVGDDAILYGAPLHPLCTLMPQQFHTSRFVDVWMLRINLVKPALEGRGYGVGIHAELGLEIEDDLVAESSGSWLLTVREGRGTVERNSSGTGPRMRCSVRTLGALYSGFYSATQAESLGMLAGDTGAIAAADAIFAGHTPWMPDRF